MKTSKLQKIMCSLLYKVRHETGLQQADFAARLRLHGVKACQSYISHIETGRVTPSVQKLEDIFSVFGYEVGVQLVKKETNE